jgi:hypothetical protein
MDAWACAKNDKWADSDSDTVQNVTVASRLGIRMLLAQLDRATSLSEECVHGPSMAT